MMKMKRQKLQPTAIIGWKEWIELPGLHIPAVKAKIDTGARTSALHTFSLEEFQADGQQMVRFGIHPLQRRKDIACFCEAPVLAQRRVKNSGGHYEKRYVIQTTAKLGAVSWSIDITLTNRDPMLFRMLLGRKAVENRFLIHPGRSYLTGRALAKSYQIKKRQKAKK
ncbi:MAG: ATP-dependent zinc protease [Desulfobacterales bacterium]|jgi:hypothetical protein